MHDASAAIDDGNEPSSVAEAPQRETLADTADPEGAVFMPLDVIVGRDTRAPGVVLMQKP